jgi:anti-sigma B factor antagonist
MALGTTTTDLVTVGSHLDVRSVGEFRTHLTAVQDAAIGDVVVDMSALEVIDLAGLGMLAAAHVRSERSGHRLVLRNCSKELRRLLAVTRLNRVLHVERTALKLSA